MKRQRSMDWSLWGCWLLFLVWIVALHITGGEK